MEPDIMPLHPSTPPPLDDDGDGETESDEDEFGDFGGFSLGVSCSPLSFADSTDSSSSLRQPSSTIKPATHQPNSSFNHPVKQSQPTSSVNSGEETGFADFTVFTEQAAHPWCCGFTPLDSTEQWDGKAAGTNSSNRLGDVEQEVIMDSEPNLIVHPTQEDGEVTWAEFKDPRAQEEERTWTQFREQVSSLQTDRSTEEEDREGQCGVSRRNSGQVSLSCRVQQLLLLSFPEVEVPAVDGEEEKEEEEVISLGALLHTQHLPESKEEEEMPEPCSRAQENMCKICFRIQWGTWWPHQDLHSAVGLRFQWGGSYTNRTLLRCLGMDTRNIVFIGQKKQPVAVPAFASGLGMLEPTKDSVPAVCPAGHTAVTVPPPPGSRVTPTPSTDSMQEALPSSQTDWSSRGLSSSQDGCSALNLDCFGPAEESRSHSSSSSNSSRSNSPPPGVDRELYELTISKVEPSTKSSHVEDTLNRLMSSAEKISTSVRKPQQDEEVSEEAGRAISKLPNLSFMRAKVLMFPSVLVPRECIPPEIQCDLN
ncbi:Aftiphilin [Larimichthys crocea]|uniref:Aftiphilin n=1 Tax=Larimichthys crocea TaxID=215358 RepID=A0A6G0HPG3_LARCR|nr:Aftiphilin [Larimichthys crocea]